MYILCHKNQSTLTLCCLYQREQLLIPYSSAAVLTDTQSSRNTCVLMATSRYFDGSGSRLDRLSGFVDCFWVTRCHQQGTKPHLARREKSCPTGSAKTHIYMQLLMHSSCGRDMQFFFFFFFTFNLNSAYLYFRFVVYNKILLFFFYWCSLWFNGCSFLSTLKTKEFLLVI